MMKLTFLGAAGTVTGSRTLVETRDAKVLIDCGLYQGLKQLRLRNWEPPPIDLSDLDAVLLTHAHIDHSGYLPALVRDGFEGPIYCTPPTEALCRVLLPDSARIHEEDAAYANRKGFSKHHPALPLYTERDAERALDRLVPLELGRPLALGDLEATIQSAGHILGAGSIELRGPAGRVLFSGDLGRDDDLMMPPPERPGAPDWIVVESTYGDRVHPKVDPIETIAAVLRRTHERGGTLLVPAFAVARAQTLFYCLHRIFEEARAPRVPVYLNSPMAQRVTELYRRYSGYHRLAVDVCDAVCDLPHYVRSVEESKELVARGTIPAVIVSASGMATGGRVLHHLEGLAPDPRNTILLPGFQAAGTRGHSIASGAAAVKIHGRFVPIRAEVVQIDFLSAHADRDDLLAWVGACERAPREIFVNHGEPVASDRLRHAIGERLGFPARVPDYRDEIRLG